MLRDIIILVSVTSLIAISFAIRYLIRDEQAAKTQQKINILGVLRERSAKEEFWEQIIE